MSPQFVDFDGDGHLDIVAGIFDGSPHLARGDGRRWQQPETILDRAGLRITGSSYWDFEQKQWRDADHCEPAGGAPAASHLTSALAFDEDGDGDLDLLLGDHESGYVYLRRNEGSATAPAFAARNELVLADGQPLHRPGTVTTLRAVDWTGDGRLDLLVGSMGDPYGDEAGGGVVVYPDVGTGAAAGFGAPVTLVARSPKGMAEPKRPDAGLYMDAADHDGDGDLDLIVGGYSLWTPPARPLSDAEQQEAARLRAELERLTARFQELNRQMLEAQEGLDQEAALARRKELLAAPERKQLNAQRAAATQRLAELVPPGQRKAFVWLYENRARDDG